MKIIFMANVKFILNIILLFKKKNSTFFRFNFRSQVGWGFFKKNDRYFCGSTNHFFRLSSNFFKRNPSPIFLLLPNV